MKEEPDNHQKNNFADSSVLIIEPKKVKHHLIQTMLDPIGVKLWHALQPELGLHILLEEQPDLIILNHDLPRINGFQLMEKIYRINRNQLTYLMMIVPHLRSDLLVQAFDRGAFDVITEPLYAFEFIARVKGALRFKAQVEDFYSEV